MEPMEAKNVRFSKRQLDDLEEVSKDRGVKVPELIRRAVEEFLDKYKGKGKVK